MTPQERQLVTDLFKRLAGLEGAPRDANAERAIAEGLARAPHAVYPLVQSVLVQDEALKRAEARIRELEDALAGADAAGQGEGFLGGVRETVFGQRERSQGSVPSVRPEGAPMGVPPGFRSDGGQSPPGAPAPQEARGQGGSFLGTAAAAAAGAIGGAFLLDGIRTMMGQRQGSFGAIDPAAAGEARSPWGGSSAGSDLSRQAGLDDIGRRGAATPTGDTARDRGFGLFDTAENEMDDGPEGDDDFDIGGDSDLA